MAVFNVPLPSLSSLKTAGCRLSWTPVSAGPTAAEAMEMGSDAALVNTAIATAEDPALMGRAFPWPSKPGGIYGITAEKFSGGRSNIQVVGQMIEGGSKIIQYREKRPAKSYRTILEECRHCDCLRGACVVIRATE